MVNWKKRATYELYRLQQKIGMTRQESYAIASILSLLLLGLVVQSIQKNTLLFDRNIYAETDSLFAVATMEMKKSQELAAPRDTSTQAPQPEVLSTITKELLITKGKVNINTASQEELETLPRIGPAMAQRIIDYRQTRGPFNDIQELTRVKGIGDKTLERLIPYTTTRPLP